MHALQLLDMQCAVSLYILQTTHLLDPFLKKLIIVRQLTVIF